VKHGWLLLILAAGVVTHAPARREAGKLFGHSVFWMDEDMRIDTLEWHDVEVKHFQTDSTDRYMPAHAVAQFAEAGLKILGVREPSAIAAAILHDCGYDVVCLSQWNSIPSGEIRFYGSGSPDDYYKQRRIVSDMIWERLEKAGLQKPGRLGGDYRVRLDFAKGGYTTLDGKEELCKGLKPLIAPTESVRLTFIDDTDVELALKRRVYEVYVVVPADKKKSRIVSEVESGMDRLKLDLSYLVPKFVDVE
jgi:hypothetical protein